MAYRGESTKEKGAPMSLFSRLAKAIQKFSGSTSTASTWADRIRLWSRAVSLISALKLHRTWWWRGSYFTC